MDSIEITAATVDEAIRQALEQLGAEADDVAIEVLTTPRAGVLGLGARQARVRVTRRAPEAATSGVMSPPPAPQPPPAGPPPLPPSSHPTPPLDAHGDPATHLTGRRAPPPPPRPRLA